MSSIRNGYYKKVVVDTDGSRWLQTTDVMNFKACDRTEFKDCACRNEYQGEVFCVAAYAADEHKDCEGGE